jgi:hypothetical protein
VIEDVLFETESLDLRQADCVVNIIVDQASGSRIWDTGVSKHL